MSSKCKSCDIIISNAEFITCAGLCGEYFHIRCVAVTKPMLAAVSNCPNIHWYCHGCNDGNRSVSSVINGINESIERLSSSLSHNLLQFLNGFKILMDKLFETVGTINIVQNKSEAAEVPDQDIQRQNNGCGEHDITDSFGSYKEKEVDIRSSAKCTNGPNIGTPHITSDYQHVKSVVISNIGKSISIDFLANYLADELKIDKSRIHVSLLLPGGKTVDDMNFLQYKVTIPDVKYSSIMDSNTWPSNVRIRDFVNKPQARVGVSLQNFIQKRTVTC
jgi:hypothetical protein